jgi:prepilin-type processing-associated H-X9-DG protein
MIGERHMARDEDSLVGQAFWATGRGSHNTSTVYPRVYTLMTVPNFYACEAIVQLPWECFRSFGAYHPGGLNFALADGSVRFISRTVNIHTLSAMASIAGQETDQLP